MARKERKLTLPGGATRSEAAPAFHLVPPEGLRRTAVRFALGVEKHGEGNWLLSLTDESDAYAFAKEAYNHMTEHALKMVSGEDPSDDHLGAIGWGVAVLAHIEERFGKLWINLDGRK